MTFAKTLPTEPGWYYWRIGKDDKKIRCREVWQGPSELLVDPGIELDIFGGEWGGRVPAPGTTWTVEQIARFLNTFSDYDEVNKVKEFLEYPVDGLAATTARHGKLWG